ncbi:hypothetical protein ACFSIL_18010 [Streptosporangium lutulentum]|uniref:hypothetical protein n=1 Tax=Streptosporangium lutulentum TaxID=1461250 RepID=UPI0027D925AB|nr:hypothetical protein [Streptosporangium lutulentum]
MVIFKPARALAGVMAAALAGRNEVTVSGGPQVGDKNGTAYAGTVKADGGTVSGIRKNPSNRYTGEFPDGAVRGQLYSSRAGW